MCEPASRGMGMQEVEPWNRAQCVSEPSSSQESCRMWDTHSMNSLGLDTRHGTVSAPVHHTHTEVMHKIKPGELDHKVSVTRRY